MPTERPACREADSDRSNLGVEAPRIKPVSRSASEPVSASLHQERSANLSDMPKPEIHCEETFESNDGDLRGEWGQRAGKVELGRLGEPCLGWREDAIKVRLESIRGVLETGKSERLIVALKRGNARGAKGPWRVRSGLKRNRKLIGRVRTRPKTKEPSNELTIREAKLPGKLPVPASEAECECQTGEVPSRDWISSPCACFTQETVLLKPDAGNLHVRFDEGVGRLWSLIHDLSFHSPLPTLPVSIPESRFTASTGSLRNRRCRRG